MIILHWLFEILKIAIHGDVVSSANIQQKGVILMKWTCVFSVSDTVEFRGLNQKGRALVPSMIIHGGQKEDK